VKRNAHLFVKISAFSLVELLVAAAVLSIVMVILLGVMTSSLTLWRNTESKVAADREGRAALLLLADDLAGAVLPAQPALWPRTNAGSLQFLTLKPRDYQSGASDSGDVCFVEYGFDPARNILTRTFFGSKKTFDDVLVPGQFPAPGGGEPQALAFNVLENNRDAAKGLMLGNLVDRDRFIILSTNHWDRHLLPITGGYNATNFPVAVQVTFGVADAETVSNTDLLADADYIPRNARLFSFRIALPPPQQ
jgi:type II secretory pathway pseudopilin PulG